MMAAEEAPTPLDIFFLPFLADGHLLPMVDMASMFSTRGISATILATPVNAPSVQPAIDSAARSGHPLRLLLLPGPPEGSCGDLKSVPPEDGGRFFSAAIAAPREPLQCLLRERRPACLVFDALFTWAVGDARDAGVPTVLAFNGTSFLAMCAYGAVHRHLPPRESLMTESVVVPGLPRRIELLRTQLPDLSLPESVIALESLTESENRSDGVLMNSFYDLEPDFVEHCRKTLGRRVWHVGPVIFYSQRAAADCSTFMGWLDGKEARSVVYVCFGSWLRPTTSEMDEISAALEAAGRPYIWVVGASHAGGTLAEDRGSKGLVVREWAPQAAILRHPAVGAFVTHCGWNSCLEALASGVPMVTWPLAAEQFYNEKLVVEVLRTGVAVGSREWAMDEKRREHMVTAEEIRRAVERVMGKEDEAGAVRRRAAELAGLAGTAVREGGSSHTEVAT